MSNVEVQKNGVGSLGIMFFILFLLKVGVVETQVILWSWWWIFLPVWIVPAILGLICVGTYAFCFVVATLASWKKSRE